MTLPDAVRQDERAAIVAYLRDCARLHEAAAERRGMRVASRYHAEACVMAADHIEAGEHLLPLEAA